MGVLERDVSIDLMLGELFFEFLNARLYPFQSLGRGVKIFVAKG